MLPKDLNDQRQNEFYFLLNEDVARQSVFTHSDKLTKTHEVLYSGLGIAPPLFWTSQMSAITLFAWMRFNNEVIKYSYRNQTAWTFSPTKTHQGWTSKTALAANKKLSWLVKMMKRLPSIAENSWDNWPDGEGVIWLGGGIHKCNVFVFDVLNDAGKHPGFMGGRAKKMGKYHTAQTIDAGKGAGIMKRVWNYKDIKPGDIVTRYRDSKHLGHHMEIVTAVKAASFNSLGYSYGKGLKVTEGKTSSSNRIDIAKFKSKSYDLRFYRMN